MLHYSSMMSINLFLILATAAITGYAGHPGEDDPCANIVISELKGFIENPKDNITNLYLPDAFCIWTFDLPEDKYVTLRFTHLDVELSNGCEDDRVEIYTAAETYERFCGNELPLPITLATNDIVYVNFITDDFNQYSGFKIQYELTDRPGGDCDGFVCKNRECVKTSEKCDGTDNCGDGSDEESCPGTSSGAAEFPLSCGLRPHSNVGHRLTPRIVGGQVASEGSWPWMVSFQKSYSFPSGHTCGGALINQRWLLTAAHCIHAVPMVQQMILLGSHWRYHKDKTQVARYVDRNCVHPEYDIALVRMSLAVNYTDSISPVCLPAANDNTMPDSVVVTGWGRTQGTGGHDYLKEVNIAVLPTDDCGVTNHFCVLDKNGRNSPCYGDSGGPVVAERSGKWQLLGLISRGSEICGFKTEPTLCTQVSAFIDWITEQIKADSEGRSMQCNDD